jgi:hypothetical protein
LGKDVELKEFKLMPHGFLGFNYPMSGMAKESKEGIKVCTEWLKDILNDEEMGISNE